MEKKQFLDYEGFRTYHEELVKAMKDLQFDPQRSFADKKDLLDLNNWSHNSSHVYGLKTGLIVTVGKQIWQLTNPETFRMMITMIGFDIETKASWTPEKLGWKVVGSTVDFDVEDHKLKLMK